MPVVLAGISALLAGYVLAALAITGMAWFASGQLFPEEPLRIAGADLRAQQVRATRDGDSLTITGLEPNPGRQEYLGESGFGFLVLGPTQVDVSGYGFVRCDCIRQGTDTSLRFFWQQAGTDEPARPTSIPFGPGGAFARLGDRPGWGGTVFELGVLIEGPLDSAMTVEALELHGDSAWSRLRWHWSDWWSIEPWSLRSINSHSLDSHNGSLPLAVVVFIATLLAVGIFLLISRRAPGRSRLSGLVAMVALSWLLLDARWMLDQAAQSRLTWETHAGKIAAERLLDARYGPIYQLARRIREADGADGRAVFLISDRPDSRFLIERLTFHLFPENPFNLAARFWLLRRHASPGDLVVVLENPAAVSHDRENSVLSWANRGRICATRLMDEGFAQVYRVCSPHP
jgi:hypothetical protein